VGPERLGEDPAVLTKGLAVAAMIVAHDDGEQPAELLQRGAEPLVLERPPVRQGHGAFRGGRPRPVRRRLSVKVALEDRDELFYRLPDRVQRPRFEVHEGTGEPLEIR